MIQMIVIFLENTLLRMMLFVNDQPTLTMSREVNVLDMGDQGLSVDLFDSIVDSAE